MYIISTVISYNNIMGLNFELCHNLANYEKFNTCTVCPAAFES